MSLDKAIEHGKEHRRPYRGPEAIDRTCRPHGGGTSSPCPWCEGNRLHKHRRRVDAVVRTQDDGSQPDA